jgi:hypothetical protein
MKALEQHQGTLRNAPLPAWRAGAVPWGRPKLRPPVCLAWFGPLVSGFRHEDVRPVASDRGDRGSYAARELARIYFPQ